MECVEDKNRGLMRVFLLFLWPTYLSSYIGSDILSLPDGIVLMLVCSIVAILSLLISKSYNIAIIFYISSAILLIVIYAAYWVHLVLELHQPDIRHWFINAIIDITQIKLALISHLFNSGNIVSALQQAIWELMPLIQIFIMPFYVKEVLNKSRISDTCDPT